MKITLYNLKKGIRYLKHYGWKEFMIRLREKHEPDEIIYADWIRKNTIKKSEIVRQQMLYRKWMAEGMAPLLSIVVYKCDEAQMEKLLHSLEKQTYKNYELCVVDDKNASILSVDEGKIHGEYVAILNNDDWLEPNALFEMVKACDNRFDVGLSLKDVASVQSGVHWLNNKSKYEEEGPADIIYSDEDFENTQGDVSPYFKTDFDLDLFYSINYLGNITFVKRNLFFKFNGDIYKAVKGAKRIVHVPGILCHSVYKDDMQKRRNSCENNDEQHGDTSPLVSIIIPNKDQKDTLRKCIDAIKLSSYKNYEIIIVENNSNTNEIFEYYKLIATCSNDKSVEINNTLEDSSVRVNIVTWRTDSTFNYSAINNYGAGFAQGQYLILLNNDIEIITTDWIEKLLGICSREEVGIVGAKLYYPDDTIQHAGIVVGVGGHARGIASNMLTDFSRYDLSCFEKTHLIRECSAVTAACLMIKKSVFDEVGGFEEYLSVAFNDVDLCLKVRKAGYLIVFNPNVEAYHYESKSRGQEDTEEKVRRFQTEIEYMRTEWNDILRYGDPYYNPGYSRVKNDYSLNGL